MKKKFLFTLLTAFAGPLLAQVGITAGVGTTGISLHASSVLKPSILNARVGFNWLDYEHDFTANNSEYKADLRLRSFDALLDYLLPAAGKLSGDWRPGLQRQQLDGSGQPTAASTFNIGGNVYTAAEVGSVHGDVEFCISRRIPESAGAMQTAPRRGGPCRPT